MKRQLAAHSAFCGIDQHLMRQDDYLFPLWPKLVGSMRRVLHIKPILA